MNQKSQMVHYDEMGDYVYQRVYLLVSKNEGGWQSIGAVVGLVCGLSSPPLALSLWIISKFIAPVVIVATLDVVSNILFALTLPLLIWGACCLDLLEKKFPLPSAEPQSVSLERASIE